MRIINGMEAWTIREKYIDEFIDKGKEYYSQNIKKLNKCSDGLCYDGYLWDCFFYFEIKDEFYCQNYIGKKSEFYILWDIHSCDKIWIKDYWKYPKDSVAQIKYSEYLKLYNTFPEDVYIFDESFAWSIAFTHETDVQGKNGVFLLIIKNLQIKSFYRKMYAVVMTHGEI